MNEDNTSILIATSNFEQLPLSTAKVSHHLTLLKSVVPWDGFILWPIIIILALTLTIYPYLPSFSHPS